MRQGVFVIDKSSFSARLKEERKRLGLNQADAAEKCGIKRETWSRYETGALTPGMEVMAAIALAGADVQYILTGVRSVAPKAPEPAPGYAVTEPSPDAGPMARKKAKIHQMVDQIDSEKGLDAVQDELERIAEVKELKRRVAELEQKAG
jgi:transcriptional regulator with XRE-family HTH domain